MKELIGSVHVRFAIVLLVTMLMVVFLVFNDGSSTIAQKFEEPSPRSEHDDIMAPMAATITGRVFQDFNGNGLYDTGGGTAAAPVAVDIGIANVVVSAYDPAGVLRGTATTVAAGTYSVAATGTGPYRVEFTSIPTGYSPSARSTDSVLGGTAANSGSTVQFVNDGGTTANVNLALNRAGDYCDNNPELCSQVYGVGAGSQNNAVFSVPYTAGSTRTTGGLPATDFQAPAMTSLAGTDDVGTTFGIAYHRPTRRVFVSAYMKKHAKFGPGGTGAIYQIDRNSGLISEYVNLNTIFGATTAGANPHNVADYNTDNGNTTWDAVGKIAFGGMAISDDQTNLWVMNLANRSLYRIPTSGPLNNTTITSYAFPATMTNCTTAPAADIRPFAVTWYQGLIYVGAVCSRENSGTPPSASTNLRAYVYSFNPTTLTFSAAPLLNIQLNYGRNQTDPGLAAEWNNWETTYQTISGSHFIYPQPMLTDIEFDRGNIILSLRDRNGDQAGYNSASNPGNPGQLFKGITAGDILRACGTPGAWTLETNSRCGGIGNGPQGNGEGPGNGEYYYQDNYHPNGDPHDEVGNGAAMQVPGHNVMVATVFDPPYVPNDNFFDAGGFRWFVNATGAQNRGYLAFLADDFGKANGMGNIQALCESSPLEIGNRIWNDADSDGVQDPGETPLAGVTVRLYQGSTLVGTAVTDANGEYYFVSSAVVDPNTTDNIGQVNGGIQPSTAYQVRLDNLANYLSGGPLSGRALSTANQTAQAGDDDSSDSDAGLVTNPAGSPAGTFAVVSITTGGAGANNHTFDIGFRLSPTAAPVEVQGRVLTAYGAGIRNVRVVLTEDDGTVHEAITGTFGYFRFTGLPAGQNVIVDVFAKRFTFSVPSQVVTLKENVSGLNFYANP